MRIERVDRAHVVRVEAEIERGDVLLQPLR